MLQVLLELSAGQFHDIQALPTELFHFGEKAFFLQGGTLKQEMKRWGKKRPG
jgi:hypothetical protein